ncbi:SDR family oxidoreductase [Eubacterium sp.]|uniref:SDR family NAD(P)-dependent oxidoreductase n=1 Tax=Eubacterium sp. TaxID=142586 RepID=UPI00258DA3C1|nr:SDR family oxidoreductase [Eubacterium sp.]MCR5368651.1 SDR family oxidoreductase [Eubacterium sp.]
MKKDLVLITGATSGIGLELTKIFAKKRCNLILVARDRKKLDHLRRKLRSFYDIEVDFIVKDLTDDDSAEYIYQKVKNSGKTVDVLVNNAGFGDYGKFLDASLEKQNKMIKCNILALTELTYYFAKDMKNKGRGRILNTASIGSFMPGPLMSVYYATKAYVLSFTEALAEEFKGTGIKVSALCPGPTDTGFWKVANGEVVTTINKLKNKSPKDVAKYGYRKMKQGRVIILPGFFTRMAPLFIRLAPRKVVRKIVYKVQKMK